MPPCVESWCGQTYNNRRLQYALVLAIEESRKVLTICQKQSNVYAPWGVYSSSSPSLCDIATERRGLFYIDIGVGLALLVSTNGAMREPFYGETSDRTGSTFLFYMPQDNKKFRFGSRPVITLNTQTFIA